MVMSVTGIKTTARGVPVTVKGFGAFKLLAAQYLAAEGIGQLDTEGDIKVNPDDWFNLDAYLRAFEKIKREVAPTVLKDSGQYVIDEARLPPTVNDITSGLGSLDVAYHLNHMKGGKPMFDLTNGKMEEGIGHFLFKPEGANKALVICDTPYPCEFDEGVVKGMAKRFRPTASISHDPKSCRNRGGANCTYVVKW